MMDSQHSQLLVLTNNKQNFTTLATLLSKYFPHAKQGLLQLNTKYYTASIKIIQEAWPQQQQAHIHKTLTEGQEQASVEHKKDMLIMLVGQKESIPAEVYDYVISKYNPQNFILIVHTTNKGSVWADEHKITNEVNNFIEVIKQNLDELIENPPQRTSKGLLNDNYEDGSIFNLLELMETTSWTNINRINTPKETQSKEEEIPAKQVQEKKQKEQASQIEQEMTDQQLESEMINFQAMMNEMLDLRAMSKQPQGTSDHDRKKKAQQLIAKLIGSNQLI